MSECIHDHQMHAGAPKVQKKASDLKEMGLQVVASCYVCAGKQHRFSAGAVNIINY